jgi:hypothetical protein
MNAILERPRLVAKPIPVEPGLTSENLGELGFTREESSRGAYWRRRVQISEAQCVGDMPVTATAGVDSAMLSWLALDPKLGAQDFGRVLFLDTETTGLGGAGTFVFLLGMMYFEAGAAWLDQVLLAGPEQESGLLDLLAERVAVSEVLVSFNGKSFDWPLLASRFVMNGIRPPLAPPHLDLLHVARRIHGARLERRNLKSLESYVLGYQREEDIDGAEVAERYLAYLRSRDAAALAQVVDHNRWDVLSMAALVALYGQLEPRLPALDLVGVARTLLRARQIEVALRVTERALELGAGADALRVRARIHRAQGDHRRQCDDLERVNADLDDALVRLELAKLYEHRFGLHERALALLELGVGEPVERALHRRERLLRKLAKRPRPAELEG